MARVRTRAKRRDIGRRTKKKVSILTSEKITYVDWKDTELLRKFLSDRAKIRARRVTGNSAQQQKMVADAIKLAREMALVPYASRVTTQRQSKDRSSYRRAEGPTPRPATPPPGQSSDNQARAAGNSGNGASISGGDNAKGGTGEPNPGSATATAASTSQTDREASAS